MPTPGLAYKEQVVWKSQMPELKVQGQQCSGMLCGRPWQQVFGVGPWVHICLGCTPAKGRSKADAQKFFLELVTCNQHNTLISQLDTECTTVP